MSEKSEHSPEEHFPKVEGEVYYESRGRAFKTEELPKGLVEVLQSLADKFTEGNDYRWDSNSWSLVIVPIASETSYTPDGNRNKEKLVIPEDAIFYLSFPGAASSTYPVKGYSSVFQQLAPIKSYR